MNWSKFNFWNIWFPFLMLFLGLMLGYVVGAMPELHTKEYPIEVHVRWPETQTEFEHIHKFEADSIHNDTIYKDGRSIVNKNIINVVFK